MYGQSGTRCGALAFDVADLRPYDVGVILNKMGLAV